MAVRLFTHGYDCFAPNETVVYHLWSRAHRPPVASRSDENKQQKSRQKSKSTANVMLQLSGDPSVLGVQFGRGTERSAAEFEEKLGVNFASRKFTRENFESGELTAEDFVEDGSSALHPPDSLEAKIASLDPNSKAMATLAKFLGM